MVYGLHLALICATKLRVSFPPEGFAFLMRENIFDNRVLEELYNVSFLKTKALQNKAALKMSYFKSLLLNGTFRVIAARSTPLRTVTGAGARVTHQPEAPAVPSHTHWPCCCTHASRDIIHTHVTRRWWQKTALLPSVSPAAGLESELVQRPWSLQMDGEMMDNPDFKDDFLPGKTSAKCELTSRLLMSNREGDVSGNPLRMN